MHGVIPEQNLGSADASARRAMVQRCPAVTVSNIGIRTHVQK